MKFGAWLFQFTHFMFFEFSPYINQGFEFSEDLGFGCGNLKAGIFSTFYIFMFVGFLNFCVAINLGF